MHATPQTARGATVLHTAVHPKWHVFFRAKTQGTAFINKQNAPTKLLGKDKCHIFLIVFIFEVFVFSSIKMLLPCGGACRFCKQIHFITILQSIFKNADSTNFFLRNSAFCVAFIVQSLQEDGTECKRKNWKLCTMLLLTQGSNEEKPASLAL